MANDDEANLLTNLDWNLIFPTRIKSKIEFINKKILL